MADKTQTDSNTDTQAQPAQPDAPVQKVVEPVVVSSTFTRTSTAQTLNIDPSPATGGWSRRQ